MNSAKQGTGMTRAFIVPPAPKQEELKFLDKTMDEWDDMVDARRNNYARADEHTNIL